MTTQYDAGYDTGVDEILFNIQRKCREVDYRFLRAELRKLMVSWIDRKKNGMLNTKPPPSPQYSEANEDDKVLEVEAPNEALEQAPPADAREEEEIASNPHPAEDEPVLITLDESPPANIREEEPIANTADDAPPA